MTHPNTTESAEPVRTTRLTLIAHEGERRADSVWLSSNLGIQHKNLMELIRRYQTDLEEFGPLAFQTRKGAALPQGGFAKAAEIALLNEDQSYFVATLSRNTARVVAVKKQLVREFGKFRRAQTHKAETEWHQARLEGKDARKHETDTIAAFVEYATAQGSGNAVRYYANLTKMTYKALFMVEQGLKMPNKLRDLLSGMQLSFLTTAEYVCANAIKDGMARELQYKEIYLLAKERIETYAVSVGQTLALPR